MAPTFWESTCSLTNGEVEDVRGEDREQFSIALPLITDGCLSISSDLSTRDLSCSVGDESG